MQYTVRSETVIMSYLLSLDSSPVRMSSADSITPPTLLAQERRFRGRVKISQPESPATFGPGPALRHADKSGQRQEPGNKRPSLRIIAPRQQPQNIDLPHRAH